MKLVGIIDCGTTNSRFSIVDSEGEIIGCASAKVGVKDTASQGSKELLTRGLRTLINETLSASGIAASELALIVSSGMITSELGLLELPHQPAPVGLDDLARNLTLVSHSEELGLGSDVYLVRGVKNREDPPPGSPLSSARTLDFMRGEETQMMGLLAIYGGGISTTVINLSSHTKYISIDSSDYIRGSITTLSGQVYESLITDSIIAKSIIPSREDALTEDSGALEESLEEAAVLASEIVRESGLLRSFLVPRFMDTLMSTDWRARKRFLEACIVADDLKVLDIFPDFGFEVGERVFLTGSEGRCKLFETLFKKTPEGKASSITIVSDEDSVRRLAIRGALEIIKKARLI